MMVDPVIWVVLAVAILLEVGATLSLRMSTVGSRWWLVPVVAGYAAAFSCLAVTLHLGLTIGVAYGIWSATGVALTAIAGKVLFNEPFTWVMTLGVVLIIGGVLFVQFGSVA